MENNDNNERIERGIKKLTGSDVTVVSANAGGYNLNNYLDKKYKGFLNIDGDHHISIMITSENKINDDEKACLRKDWVIDSNVEMNKKIKSIIVDLKIPINDIESDEERNKFLDNITFVDTSDETYGFPKYMFFSYSFHEEY